jgi:release factor glutamine methyltransferase
VRRHELTSDLALQLGAPHEARFIVDDVLGVTGPGVELTPDQVARATELAERRRAGEPLQYVLGHWAFRDLDLLVDPRVLIPRPETERVVEVALSELVRLATPTPTVVDAGTGSGAIALALATELARRGRPAEVFAVDASPEALAVARANLDRVGQGHGAIDGPGCSITLLEGSWLEPLPEARRGAIDLVVSNPPYVAETEWPDLDDEVKAEPRQALVAPAGSEGTPGLADVEAVLTQALAWLARPGTVVIELAPHQAEAGARLARTLGYDEVAVAPDLSGRLRVLIGRLA